MIKKAIIASLVTGVFVLVGCSQAEPTPTEVAEATAVPPTATVNQVEEIVEPTPEIEVIDSIEEFAGTWRFTGTQFRRYFEDGTMIGGESLDQIDIRMEAGEFDDAEYWFEDGLFHITNARCEEGMGVSEPGVFQIQVVDEEKIQFILVEDPCTLRGTVMNKQTASRVEEE
jgi:hypothetical protein